MTPRRDPIPTVPVGLRVEGRLVVVIGAGPIAARKAAAHLEQGARLRVVAPDHGTDMDALGPEAVGPDRIERLAEPYRDTHLDGAWLVVAATGQPEVDGQVFADAERRRLWCNAADDPEHCSVVLPAVVRRGPVTIGIGTGGTSPATATWLRRRLTDLVERELLTEPTLAAAEVASAVRTELLAAGRPTEVDGWQQALDEFEARLRSLVVDADPVTVSGR